ncbi:GNAT family N-acetyltransferase [Shimazuella kribbensis]|uniref:GNAT family N-acetyltransferase n=1 Tax=Shimazuella kribbensis TaxID=139808 RepID=UPI00041DD8B0|nr:GNAT family N-acetyltransferase [Shimazuella kribbensis]
MDIIIKEQLAEDEHKPINIDGSFTVDGVLVLSLQNNQITYTVQQVPPFEKSYADEVPEEIDEDDSDDSDDLERIVYLAIAGDRVVGQIKLKRNWNKYAYIEEILVDKQYRGLNIGKKLIQQAIQWAKVGKMPGIMLETQNNNVAACKFYESCGFVLGGFDAFVYKGLDQTNNEIALYWYLVFE